MYIIHSVLSTEGRCTTDVGRGKRAAATGFLAGGNLKFNYMFTLSTKRDGDHRPGREAVYARHASAAFNRRMHKILRDLCRELASALGNSLHAVLLGGNYGRGEGGTRGVMADHGSGVWSIGEAPTEDIDLLIVAWFRISGRKGVIKEILNKYARIFSVPIDLLPVITPLRLYFVPFRFNWRRLIRNSAVLYGPLYLSNRLSRFYGHQKQMNPLLSWSLLMDQGLRLLEAIAIDQKLITPSEEKNLLIHQGKFFREIVQAVLLVSGRYCDPVDLQLHEFIWLVEEGRAGGPYLRLLKSLLPKSLLILRTPEQAELNLPENWLFHLNLWLEAYGYLSGKVKRCSSMLMGVRLPSVVKSITSIAKNQGKISESENARVFRLLKLLGWCRNHIVLV